MDRDQQRGRLTTLQRCKKFNCIDFSGNKMEMITISMLSFKITFAVTDYGLLQANPG